MQKKAQFILIFIFLSSIAIAQSKHGPVGKFPSYKGLVMAGYQGWFRTPDDGSGSEWGHYGRDGKFDEEHVTVDFWPDVTEYEKTYETDFKQANGSSAKVFSSVDPSTTDLHFQWMKEYGVDGVFMQRFFGVTRGYERSDKSSDIILKNALNAAEKNDRAIAVMYDLSGLRARGEDCSSVIEDWKMLVDELKVTSHQENQNYLFHNGKPLVAIWGLGFPDRPYNIRDIGVNRLIDFLKNDPVYGGCAVMLGVPTYFRELNKDCLPDPYLHELIRSADIVLPWMVQRFTPLVHEEMSYFRDHVMADIAWAKENGVDYVPIVYPGFSWRNLSLANPDLAKYTAYGAIPRLRGEFYWDLIYTSLKSGAEMLYVAMFDEVDEGTAIFKVSDNPPSGDKIKFVGNDGMPSDHYLFLTGQAGQMLRREVPLMEEMPVQ
uniref:Glycoside hydrolase family 71/99-like protein n=1 Tax=Roseihalotalea indica TaxID=2867963 RepID=A0AA49JIJ9_9BACT|nr:glycoside hydrolase family 71/99-like protein [Tunicatimonas sp. TK19036]